MVSTMPVAGWYTMAVSRAMRVVIRVKLVIAELKRKYPRIPVIAISGLFNSGNGMDADAAIQLGAARTLVKPFKRGDLLRAVADLLGATDG